MTTQNQYCVVYLVHHARPSRRAERRRESCAGWCEPFLVVTELISGASYPTLSMVLPVLYGLLNLLMSTAGGLDVLHDVLVHHVQEKFGDLFQDDELCMASVVDPRFKLVPFDTEERQQHAVSATLCAMARATSESPAADSSADGSSTPPVPPSQAGTASIWAKLDASAAASAATAVTSADVRRNQLDAYLAATGITRDADPLTWWSTNQATFPAVQHAGYSSYFRSQ